MRAKRGGNVRLAWSAPEAPVRTGPGARVWLIVGALVIASALVMLTVVTGIALAMRAALGLPS